MKELPFLLFPLILVALATPVAGQLFPYDKEMADLSADQNIVLQKLEAHTRVFGNRKTQLEIYFEPMELVETKPGYAFTQKCTETLFIQKMEVTGNLIYTMTDRVGRYLFYFHRDGCFVLTTIQQMPDGTYSQSNEVWGRCQKTKRL